MTENYKNFDIIVLGGGPGGYPAAIRAAQLGKSVALIEGKEIGGTCLNRGCIPSKALIAGAELYARIQEASEFGIEVEKVSFNYEKLVKRKDLVVSKLRKSLENLILANGVQIIRGYGTFLEPHVIKVEGKDNVTLKGEKIIIASGSEPKNIPAFPFDQETILDSTALLDIKKLPKKLVIIGGGIIGSEFASLFNIFGVEVTILEMLPSILPMEDESVSTYLTKAFKKKGIAIHTGAKVEKAVKSKQGVKVEGQGFNPIEADLALVAVGRTMNVGQIGLEKTGIKLGTDGFIPVNEQMETSVKGIYAVGDPTSKWWLAHVATHQGLIAADNACGVKARMDYLAVPSAIFTQPEIATVGIGPKEAAKRGYDVVVGNFPFQALGKSQATFQMEGFAQIVTDKKTGQILGAQVVGHEASALIAEMTLAINNELTIECVAETIHAHPTIAESWLEAALLAIGHPVHFPKKT